MIAWVWLSESGELFGLSLPVECATVNDDSAERSAVSADELCCGVHHDVCSVFDGADEEWCAEGVVDDERYAVFVCYLAGSVEVGHVGVWVAECLHIYRLGVWLYGLLEQLEVVDVDDGVCDSLCGESVCDEVV